MKLKNIAFTIALPELEYTHDLVSYAESERGLAELLAVAPGTQVAVKFSEAEAEEGEVAAERFSRQYESIARHFAVLEKSGNPIIGIRVGQAIAASRPPYAALAKFISRQRQPPGLHLAGGWCTEALAEAKGFEGLADLRLEDSTSATGWAAFTTFVTECAATLRKLNLDFTIASDAAPSYVRPSQIQLPHLRTLSCNFEEGVEYDVNALLVCKAPVLRCLNIALYELPGSGIHVDDIARCFPSLERLAIWVTVADEQDLQALASLLDGDPAHRHAVSVSVEDAGIGLTLEDEAPAHLRACAPFIEVHLTVGIHNTAGCTRQSGRWHTHLNFERLRLLSIFAWNVIEYDAIAARRQWEKAMSFLRDNHFPAVHSLDLRCGTVHPPYFMELANILALPAFPAINQVQLKPAPDTRQSSTWSEYDRLCLGHLRDVCRERRIALNLVVP